MLHCVFPISPACSNMGKSVQMQLSSGPLAQHGKPPGSHLPRVVIVLSFRVVPACGSSRTTIFVATWMAPCETTRGRVHAVFSERFIVWGGCGEWKTEELDYQSGHLAGPGQTAYSTFGGGDAHSLSSLYQSSGSCKFRRSFST